MDERLRFLKILRLEIACFTPAKPGELVIGLGEKDTKDQLNSDQ